MKSFLEILADEILAKYGEQLSQICIVFPSRRAGIFYKKILSGKIEKALWSPAILGVQDFIAQLSPYTIAEKLALIFELYESYKGIAAEETFDKFYPWGEMMLNDFDEIDKNLVEADYLFRVLKEHKEVQQQFDFSPADSDDFFRFWRTFSNRELSDYQKDFIKTWEVMGKVYHNFRKKLMAANICYEGMAYRKIYELARTNKLDLKWGKIIFAGFNELNKAEEGIIRELVKQDIMDLYWDADNYYVKNPVMEAGKFLRQNFASLNVNGALWISDELAKSKKEIKIVGASLKAGQAKALGYLLEETGNASENTAVVLPDESLLMPVLHSIPEDISSLNVTMGFPFRNSVLYNLITGLKNLQKNKKGEGDKTFFYHKNCIQILSHPYIKLINAGKCFKIINEINKRNIIYINRERILQFAEEDEKIFRLLFTEASDSSDIIIYLFEIITEISSVIEGKAPYSQRFEKEFFFALYDGLSHLKNLILKYETAMESDTFWNLIIEILSHIRIPFTGEPLKGLQVMGLLETRSIDFENVYILSMNEGTVPKAGSKGSFIPYHLRKAFKMPTFEDEDASFAYYFYRLLQKAKNVTLIYNTETVGVQPGEKSRYILQLKNELALTNKAITFNEFIFQPGVGTFPEKHIKVNKTPEMIDFLAGREFSPSAISQYINCSLKFYFNRVARLRKEISVEEVLSGAAFGSLLHEIMKQLYIVKKNKIMTKKDLQEIKKALEKDFDTIWKNACSQINDLREFSDGLYGKNLLFKNIIKKLVKLILDNDVHEVPFNIIEIEGALTGEIQTEVNGNSYKIKLRGILDRVEEKNGITKIIDYKTGKFKMQETKGSIDDFFNEAFTDPKNKETFQQYFYAMLFNDKFPSAKLNIGIYPLRTIGKGIEFYEHSGTVPPEKIEEFRKKLRTLFSEILDLNVPFEQTDDPENCKFCDFIPICYREQGK